MRNYILKRLLLIPLTLLGILAINFVIIQFAPGGQWNIPWPNTAA